MKKTFLCSLAIAGSMFFPTTALAQLTAVTKAGNAPAEVTVSEQQNENGLKKVNSKVLSERADKVAKQMRKAQKPNRIPALPAYADMPLLYAYNYMDNTWLTVSKLGDHIFSFHPGEIITYNAETPALNIDTPMAACYANGNFYFFDSALIDDDKVEAVITGYNATTWEKVLETTHIGDYSWDYYFRQVAAYDAETGLIYTVTWGDGKPLMAINPVTLETRKIGKTGNIFAQDLFFVGSELYMIGDGTPGSLYKVNKENGSATLVGTIDPGLSVSTMAQSAFTDPSTGITYWAVSDYYTLESQLCTFDVNSTEDNFGLQTIADFPGDEHFLGLYIPYVVADAPGATTQNKFENGVVSCVAPTKTYSSGQNLTGNVTVVFTIDGVATEKTAAPGAVVTYETALADGAHVISIIAKNAQGNGPERRFSAFVGEDQPGVVENLSFNIGGNTARLSWTKPTTSVHGGPVDDAKLNYTIVRYPDEAVVATGLTECSYTETVPETRDHYSYEIISYAGDIKGSSAFTEALPGGSIYQVPFTEDFLTADDFATFKVIDANNDQHTWSYTEISQCATLLGNGVTNPETGFVATNNDDYLISAPIELKAGVDYRVDFDLTQLGNNENLRILLGKTQNITGNETLIKEEYIHWQDYYTMTSLLDVEEDGLYHLILHSNTKGNSSIMHLEDIKMTIEGAHAGPAAVENLTATAGAKGAIENTITFNAPTTTYKGEALDNLTKIAIFKGEDMRHPVAVFDNPAKGAAISWNDPAPEAGAQNFSVVAYNEAGQGKTAVVKNWLGIDVPAAPTSVHAYQNADFTAAFTWDAVTEVGAHGGYVDTSAVKYRVMKYNSMDWSNPWPVSVDNIDGTEAVDGSVVAWDSDKYPYQKVYNFCIAAFNELGQSEAVQTHVTIGHPYSQPYTESFKGGTNTTTPFTLYADSYYYAWDVVTGDGLSVKPYDNDGGMMQFTYIQPESNTQYIEGPRVYVKDSDNSELSFYMWHGFEAEEDEAKLIVLINPDDKGFEVAGEFDYNIGFKGWARHSVKLPANVNNITYAFAADAIDASASIFVDKITVEQGVAESMVLAGFSAPKRVQNGSNIKVNVAVSNYGQNTTGDYTVTLTRNGEAFDTFNGSALKQNAVKNIAFNIPTTIADATKTYTLAAELTYAADSKTDDNKSEDVQVYVAGVPYPSVTDLAGETAEDGKVTLTWTKPNALFNDDICDDIEDYEDFIIDGIGDWTTYDGDGNIPVYFGGPEIPNCFEPQAWQVWSPEPAGYSTERFDVLTAHSGNKYLAGWASSDGVSELLENDDWLISCDVLGGTDVSFWARNPIEGTAPEVIEVLYSTTDDDPTSFEVIDCISIEGTTAWINNICTLPTDAKFFALRNAGKKPGGNASRTVVFVDDITYTPLFGTKSELELNGYKVYRDGVLLGSTADATFVDMAAPAGNHVYQVTANWVKGESVLSNEYNSELVNGVTSYEYENEDEYDVYNVAGQRVNGGYRGIVIRKGKKTVSK